MTEPSEDEHMKLSPRTLAGLALLVTTAPVVSHAQTPVTVNGMPSVTITRKPTPGATKPEFTSMTLLPGRGLEVQQITAFFPGKGEVNVLASPSLEESAKMLNDQDTPNGDLGYRLGAAFLFPYPNRIRGKLSADGKTLTTEWKGKTITLPANNIGKESTAERHAMHGLILKAKVEDLKVNQTAEGGSVTGVIHGGNFDGHWLSKTDLVIKVALTAEGVDASIVAHNVGNEPEPVAIAWHPYFNLPSGDRKQARLHVPGSAMAEVDNYDNVFPTGKIKPVAGTPYDFQAPEGKALGGQFLDDNFSHLESKSGVITVTITDPAAKYGVKIEGLSPNVKTIQVYAPPAQSFVAVEHQFNFADPFGKEWGNMDTQMVTLAPGKSTQWHVRLKVFVP
jgi:galactose mutarotase-like enzyme